MTTHEFEYAIYKGDELICIGSKNHLSRVLGLKLSSIEHLCKSLTYDAFLQKPESKKKFAIKIDITELNDEVEAENKMLGIDNYGQIDIRNSRT